MVLNIILIITAVILGAAGLGIGLSLGKKNAPAPQPEDLTEAQIQSLVQKTARDKIDAAEKEAFNIRDQAEERAKKLRAELVEQENLFVEREKALNERSKLLDVKSGELESAKGRLKKLEEALEVEKSTLKTELEKISGLTRDEARARLEKEIEEEMVNYKARLIRDAEQKAEADSEERAKKILIESMQRIVTDYVGETTTTVLKVEDEKVKGRIIGKEGRNIRAFEKATGVDVSIDEAPNAIALSSFDPLRREIAKVALSRLIEDGRIHPGSIEEEIRKAKNEIAIEIKKNGQILAEEANWPGMDIGLIKLVGKLKYRTSYGQSMMKHTIEVIRIGAMLAAETGADIDLVKKACLLHDVGKVLTHKVEGPHHHISGQIGRKYGLSDKLVNAIEAHHLDIKPESVEAVIVHLADAISGARPGARKDSYEQFIKRVEGIEKSAKEVGGSKIDEVFAIHAGRELRVIVKPNETTDDEITVMAKAIADKIRETQNYPGTVEVVVIRESRVSQLAT